MQNKIIFILVYSVVISSYTVAEDSLPEESSSKPVMRRARSMSSLDDISTKSHNEFRAALRAGFHSRSTPKTADESPLLRPRTGAYTPLEARETAHSAPVEAPLRRSPQAPFPSEGILSAASIAATFTQTLLERRAASASDKSAESDIKAHTPSTPPVPLPTLAFERVERIPTESSQRWSRLAAHFRATEEQTLEREMRLDLSTRHGSEDVESGRIIGTFNGGGIRGIAVGQQIVRLEEETGIGLARIFDVTGGTSVGALMAAAAATGRYSGKDTIDILRKNGPEIFTKQWFSFGGTLRPRYDRTALDRVLHENFGNVTLADMPIPFSAVAVGQRILSDDTLDVPEPITFKSYSAKQDTTKNALLRDVLGASSAAPSYFAAHPFIYDGDRWMGMDGGLIANAPDIETMLHANASLEGGLHRDDVVVAFRTGDYVGPPQKEGVLRRMMNNVNPFGGGGLLEQASGVFSAFMDGQSQRSERLTGQFMAMRGMDPIHNFNFDMHTPLKLDDASEEYMDALAAAGDAGFDAAYTEALGEAIRHRVERKDR